MANLDTKITITAVDKASAAIRNVQGSLKNLHSAVDRASNAWGNFAGKLRTVAFAVFGLSAAITGVVKSNAEMAESILNASQKAGVSVEGIQKWRHAAEMSGVEASKVDLALKFLNHSLVVSQKATTDQAKAFKALHLDPKQFKGADDALMAISAQFQKMPDGARKTAIAMALLGGRMGTSLIPVLNEGPEAIAKFTKELTELGFMLDETSLKNAKEAGDKFRLLGIVFRSIAWDITSAFIPALNDSNDGLIAWYKTNREWVKLQITEKIHDAVASFKEFKTEVYNVILALKPFYTALGGLGNILKFLAGVWIAGLIVSFANLVIALYGLTSALVVFGAVLMSTPIGWFIGLVSGLALLAYKLYQSWDSIAGFFKKVWTGIKEAFGFGDEAAEGAKKFSITALDALNPLILALKLLYNTYMAVKNAFGSSSPVPAFAGAQGLSPTPSDSGSKIFKGKDTSLLAPETKSSQNSALPPVPGFSSTALQAPSPQHLDIFMRIDADGRPKDVSAKSSGPITFKANTGVVPP